MSKKKGCLESDQNGFLILHLTLSYGACHRCSGLLLYPENSLRNCKSFIFEVQSSIVISGETTSWQESSCNSMWRRNCYCFCCFCPEQFSSCYLPLNLSDGCILSSPFSSGEEQYLKKWRSFEENEEFFPFEYLPEVRKITGKGKLRLLLFLNFLAFGHRSITLKRSFFLPLKITQERPVIVFPEYNEASTIKKIPLCVCENHQLMEKYPDNISQNIKLNFPPFSRDWVYKVPRLGRAVLLH